MRSQSIDKLGPLPHQKVARAMQHQLPYRGPSRKSRLSLPSLDCMFETVRPFSFAGAQVNEGTLPERLRFAVLNNWRHVRDRSETCLRLD
jgi:hypothetical protein